MKKIIFSVLTVSLFTVSAMALNPVNPAMPSLTIAPDGRAAGMGDVGVATNADLNSQHWNPAKYAFMESKGGITVSYTPWLTKLVDDINLAYIAGYYNMGDMAGTLSASFTYFSMGEVKLVDIGGVDFADATPNEWALDLAYSRKLHEYVSMAVALRFLYSDLTNGANFTGTSAQEMYPGWTMAADVALYYKQPISLPMGDSYFGLGLNISNLGGKITHDEGVTQNFIPSNLRLGVSYEIPFDNYNRLMATVECNKMLVPTYYSKFATDQTKHQYTQDEYSAISTPNGWWQSFCDAPGYTTDEGKVYSPLAEEFQEVQWGVGLEYSYNRQFFGRVGYSHENFWKGNRRYVTVGAGFHLSIFSLDFAYCIATAPSNPLDQTMRFTLGFDLAGIKDLVNNRK
ncbi:MAG: type IX secretion system outer membrane channel protein PorV [Paludibacteraceae bacterium]|nr:type IX secretion system outer membrane channel protein PorV [Paludibacteraceae bacterium]